MPQGNAACPRGGEEGFCWCVCCAGVGEEEGFCLCVCCGEGGEKGEGVRRWERREGVGVAVLRDLLWCIARGAGRQRSREAVLLLPPLLQGPLDWLRGRAQEDRPEGGLKERPSQGGGLGDHSAPPEQLQSHEGRCGCLPWLRRGHLQPPQSPARSPEAP